jgi:hypothetical protein
VLVAACSACSAAGPGLLAAAAAVVGVDMRRELNDSRLLCLQGAEAATAGLQNLRDSMCGQAQLMQPNCTHPAVVNGHQMQLNGA